MIARALKVPTWPLRLNCSTGEPRPRMVPARYLRGMGQPGAVSPQRVRYIAALCGCLVFAGHSLPWDYDTAHLIKVRPAFVRRGAGEGRKGKGRRGEEEEEEDERKRGREGGEEGRRGRVKR